MGCRSRVVWAIAVQIVFGSQLLAAEPLDVKFEEVAGDLGVVFRHQDGRTGVKHYVETTASGVGWIDIDADGDVDLYLLNGAAPPGSTHDDRPRNAVFENERGRFRDATDESGLGDDAFSMGMCVLDADGDGLLDIFVANYGPDRLFRGLGEGRFVDVASEAGVADSGWSSSCAAGDLDADGDLDLYVTRYVDFGYGRGPECGDVVSGLRLYCRPIAFDGVGDALYLNRGDGTFEELGTERGIASGTDDRGLGVLMSDVDGDGDLDLYVANDGTVNRLYVNDGRGYFEDRGLLSGTGLNEIGLAEASMGLDAGDVDGDGRLDLVATHFAMETNTLYRNRGGLQFDDVSASSGLGRPSYRMVGWGVAFLDFDLDGDLDLAVANGHMQENIEQLEPGLVYAQPNQVFEGDGSGRFRDVSTEVGGALAQARVSRGLAVGDFDDDGRPDLVVTNTNDRPSLLHNRGGSPHHWLGIELEGPKGNRPALGARVELVVAGETQLREVRSGGSFQSQSDLRLLFGLGDSSGPVEIRVRWPNGSLQVESTSELNRYLTLTYATE